MRRFLFGFLAAFAISSTAAAATQTATASGAGLVVFSTPPTAGQPFTVTVCPSASGAPAVVPGGWYLERSQDGVNFAPGPSLIASAGSLPAPIAICASVDVTEQRVGVTYGVYFPSNPGAVTLRLDQ